MRQPKNGKILLDKAKPFNISKHLVWDAYRKIKANRGAAGVDGQTIDQFEENLKDNLYKLWKGVISHCQFVGLRSQKEMEGKGL